MQILGGNSVLPDRRQGERVFLRPEVGDNEVNELSKGLKE